jgi:ADP-heptose:LPS heptosyltransferase
MRGGPHVLVARQDSAGDVLLAGPAVRAVAAGAGRVTLLCGPRGREAAALLPGVDEVLVRHAPWIDATPQPVTRATGEELVDTIAALAVDQALVLTSFHQSPLPLALLLRMAGVPTIAAISVDYPGTLLDVRHLVDDDLHEVERALSLAATLGYRLPDGDDGRLAVRRGRSTGGATSAPTDRRTPSGFPGPLRPDPPRAGGPYVAVHPGAAAPARAWAPDRHTALVDALAAEGRRVVVTGSQGERALTALVAGPPPEGSGRGGPGDPEGVPRSEGSRRGAPVNQSRRVTDLGGRLDLAGLAEVLAGADALVAGNTGPAHLAAAVGTPVVSLFSPVVPAVRWRPWKVPHVLLGDQRAACAGTRARTCPIPGHPCLDGVPVAEVVAAVERLAPARPRQEAGV